MSDHRTRFCGDYLVMSRGKYDPSTCWSARHGSYRHLIGDLWVRTAPAQDPPAKASPAHQTRLSWRQTLQRWLRTSFGSDPAEKQPDNSNSQSSPSVMYTLHQIRGWTLLQHETIDREPPVIRVSFVKDAPGLPGATISAEAETLSQAVDKCRALIRSLGETNPDAKLSLTQEIRAQGWTVAVHHDYRLQGVPCTFWLFTKGDFCVKGEGQNDEAALEIVRQEILRVEAKWGLQA